MILSGSIFMPILYKNNIKALPSNEWDIYIDTNNPNMDGLIRFIAQNYDTFGNEDETDDVWLFSNPDDIIIASALEETMDVIEEKREFYYDQSLEALAAEMGLNGLQEIVDEYLPDIITILESSEVHDSIIEGFNTLNILENSIKVGAFLTSIAQYLNDIADGDELQYLIYQAGDDKFISDSFNILSTNQELIKKIGTVLTILFNIVELIKKECQHLAFKNYISTTDFTLNYDPIASEYIEFLIDYANLVENERMGWSIFEQISIGISSFIGGIIGFKVGGTIGGVAGGAIGGAIGSPSGPGAISTAAGGTIVGGAVGAAAGKYVGSWVGGETAKQTCKKIYDALCENNALSEAANRRFDRYVIEELICFEIIEIIDVDDDNFISTDFPYFEKIQCKVKNSGRYKAKCVVSPLYTEWYTIALPSPDIWDICNNIMAPIHENTLTRVLEVNEVTTFDFYMMPYGNPLTIGIPPFTLYTDQTIGFTVWSDYLGREIMQDSSSDLFTTYTNNIGGNIVGITDHINGDEIIIEVTIQDIDFDNPSEIDKYRIYLYDAQGNEIDYEPYLNYEPVNGVTHVFTISNKDLLHPVGGWDINCLQGGIYRVVVMEESIGFQEEKWIGIDYEIPYNPTTDITNIVQITDTHISENTAINENLENVIMRINEIKPNILLVTGDLVEWASDWDPLPPDIDYYGNFNEIINEVSEDIEVRYIIGNHDIRLSPEILPPFFSYSYTPYLEFLNSKIDSLADQILIDKYDDSNLILLGLDSNDKDLTNSLHNDYSGEISNTQLIWLENNLNNNENQFILYMHHPVFAHPNDYYLFEDPTISDDLDTRDSFIDACQETTSQGNSKVSLVLAGHTHSNGVWEENGKDLTLHYPILGKQLSPTIEGFSNNFENKKTKYINTYSVKDQSGYRVIQCFGDNSIYRSYTSEYSNPLPTIQQYWHTPKQTIVGDDIEIYVEANGGDPGIKNVICYWTTNENWDTFTISNMNKINANTYKTILGIDTDTMQDGTLIYYKILVENNHGFIDVCDRVIINVGFVSSDIIAKGLSYLRGVQQGTPNPSDGDGSWYYNVGITALCTLAFLNYGYTESDPVVLDGVNYLLNNKRDHGNGMLGIYNAGSLNRATYMTSLSLLALKATNNPDYDDEIEAMKKFLVHLQWDENSYYGSVSQSNYDYGGFGYGSHSRPDMSNTQFALMALSAAGATNIDDDDCWDDALVFLNRVHKSTGAYTYTPGNSEWGSMTAAGLWSLRLAGIQMDGPLITNTQPPYGALDWIKNHYTWDYNPGEGQDAYYYYCMALSKALVMCHLDNIVINGGIRDWSTEMFTALEGRQRDDGSWRGTSPRWENIPELATAYALLSLETRALPPGADLWTSIILASHADLHIYDSSGRHTGKVYDENGLWTVDIDNEIPGSLYEVVNGEQIVNLSQLNPGTYRIELVGTSDGPYDLTIIGGMDDQEVYRKSWPGQIIDGMVHSATMTVTAMTGALTIIASDPAIAPVLDVTPNNLTLYACYGGSISDSFTVSSMFANASDVTIHAIDMQDGQGNIIDASTFTFSPNGFPITVDDTIQVDVTGDIPVLSGGWSYTGKFIVESTNAGVKAIDVNLVMDHLPPVTTKHISEPKYGLDDLHVTPKTLFSFTADDDISGVSDIYYRTRHQGAWIPVPGSGVGTDNNFMAYTNAFTLTGEGEHFIEFYSIDLAGNLENITNQTHIVYDWWDQYHHDTSKTGSSLSTIPDAPSMKWQKYLSGMIISSPAVVYDHHLYVGSMNGRLYCMDASDGMVQWSYATGAGIRSSPVVVDQYVYVGSTDNHVYCLNAETGELLWKYQTGYPIFSSPMISHGKVFVGSNDGCLYCIDAVNGEKLWSASTGAFIYSSPAVVENQVFVSSGDGFVYCFNTTNGHLLWKYLTNGVVFSSPVVVDGSVFVGSTDGNLYSIDAYSGNLLWKYKTWGSVISSPAVCDTSVFICSSGGQVSCLNKVTGTVDWVSFIGPCKFSSPAVADGKLVVGTADGMLCCLENGTGTLLWNRYLGGEVLSSPAVYNDCVFIGCNNGFVYCYDETIPNTINIQNVQATPIVATTGSLVNIQCDISGDTIETVILEIDNPSGETIYEAMQSTRDEGYEYTDIFDTIGTYSYEIKVEDTTGQITSSETHGFEVVSTNNILPTATADTYTMFENMVLYLDAPGLMINDADQDNGPMDLTCHLITDVSHGILDFSEDGSFTYYPQSDFIGTDSFTYQVYDGINYSNTVVVTIIVKEANIQIADINDDGQLNSADIRYLAMNLCGDPVYETLFASGDINSDARINSADVRYLAMYLVGDPVYSPLYP